MAAVFFYISGHGFGHASRQIEIINVLGALRTDLQVVIRTSAEKWLFEKTVTVPVVFLAGACDTGIVQLDSLRLDERATIERATEFYRALTPRTADEARLLCEHDARLVIADAPPLACAAAARAGVRSVVVANFTWDWIYEAYDAHLWRAPGLLDTVREAYGRAEYAWRLPMHGGFRSIRTIVDVPMVARHARREPHEIRDVLGLPQRTPLVLTSFGGIGVHGLDFSRLDCLSDCEVVVTREGASDDDSHADGIHVIVERALYGAGLRYEDLVRAVDVVVTKPGYGIIAECVANDTAILYTSRGRFAEYDVLVSEMPRFLRCQYISQEDLFSGRWRDPIRTLLSSAPPPERPATNGADVVARMIAETL